MKFHLLLMPVLLFVSTSAIRAQDPPPVQSSGTASDFESNAYIATGSFVPAASMSGLLHSVDPQAYNNGLQNVYQLTAGGATYQIVGTPLLLQRINEIYAIEYLRNLSKTDEFAKALSKAAGQKLDSVVGAVKDPVGTVKNIPKGASRFFGSLGESLKGGKSENEGSALDNVAGTSKAKAQLAFKLGVSPYSDNRDLQEQLNNTAWAMAGGGLILTAASAAATGGVGAALSVVSVNETLQNTLINTPPSQLRITNRKKLFAFGLDRDEADAFLMHPHFSPVHQTVIVDALARIGANPRVFLAAASKAANQEDAFYFQRIAQLLLQYHTTVAPVKSILIEDGLVCGLDRNGTLVIPVSLDYATWNERIAMRMDQFSALPATSKNIIKAFALWTDGQLSDRLRDELKKRHIDYGMLALDAVATK